MPQIDIKKDTDERLAALEYEFELLREQLEQDRCAWQAALSKAMNELRREQQYREHYRGAA